MDRPLSWREPELWLLLAVLVLGYFVAIEIPSLRGEESRRAQVAVEILRTGDWVVPRQQGEPFVSRPPLGSWPIAALGMLRGKVDLWAIRLPTLLSTALTALLIYGYARRFLQPLGSFAAAVGFATMAQVLQLGRLAESEAIFTLFVAASLLVWHAGIMHRPDALWPWLAGYFFVALGTLTKGPQAPAYFGATVGVYLLWQRQWRVLFSWQHLLGFSLFAALFLAWLVPFTQEVGLSGTRAVFGGDVGLRFVDLSWTLILTHLALFPLETFAVMLPCSLGILGYLIPQIRQGTAFARPYVGFAVIALAVAFPTVWLAPRAMTRYFMPLFPMVAVLSGIVVHHLTQSVCTEGFLSLNRWFTTLAMVGAGLTMVALWFVRPDRLIQATVPLGFALIFLAGGIALSAFVLRSRPEQMIRRGLCAWASFMLLANGSVYLPNQHLRSVDNAAEVAEVKRRLAGQKLVSFDWTHHLFAYYFGEPIEVHPWPSDLAAVADDVRYFCFSTEYQGIRPLPFPYEVVTVVNCDRARSGLPRMTVVVGRRQD